MEVIKMDNEILEEEIFGITDEEFEEITEKKEGE